jgi:hypothetical protein
LKKKDTEQPPDPAAKKLLDSLEQKEDDQVALTTLHGRALSRSSINLHMAIGGGMVAIPIVNIKQVIQISDSHPDAVSVIIRNPQDIQPLLAVKPAKPPFSGEGFGNVEAARLGEKVPTNRKSTTMIGVGTCTITETDTITGFHGETDQCDDSETDNCPPDDLNE